MPNWPEKMDALGHLHIKMTVSHSRRLDHEFVPIFKQLVNMLPPYLPEVITIEIMTCGD